MSSKRAFVGFLVSGALLGAMGCGERLGGVASPSGGSGADGALSSPGLGNGSVRARNTTDPVLVTVRHTSFIATASVFPGETKDFYVVRNAYTVDATQGTLVAPTWFPTVTAVGLILEMTLELDGFTAVFVRLIGIPDPPPPGPCKISGAQVGTVLDLEGRVATGNAASFGLQANDGAIGLVDVNAAGAVYRCVGQAKGGNCPDKLQPGAQVHVKGSLSACNASSAVVDASEVKIQKP